MDNRPPYRKSHVTRIVWHILPLIACAAALAVLSMASARAISSTLRKSLTEVIFALEASNGDILDAAKDIEILWTPPGQRSPSPATSFPLAIIRNDQDFQYRFVVPSEASRLWIKFRFSPEKTVERTPTFKRFEIDGQPFVGTFNKHGLFKGRERFTGVRIDDFHGQDDAHTEVSCSLLTSVSAFSYQLPPFYLSASLAKEHGDSSLTTGN